jgi:large subunit ribosomal protein L21
MEAIFRDGGRQYTVREGTTVDVDYRDVEPGSSIEFREVLYVKDLNTDASQPRLGSPLVSGARVVGTVVAPVKGKKLIVANFRRRKNSKRRVGHRQKYTRVQIQRIEA